MQETDKDADNIQSWMEQKICKEQIEMKRSDKVAKNKQRCKEQNHDAGTDRAGPFKVSGNYSSIGFISSLSL